MQQILVLGIGRSTFYFLEYLHNHIIPLGYSVRALDMQVALVAKRQKEFPNIQFVHSDIDAQIIAPWIVKADVVVSMLPPVCHTMVAEICLREKKHFFTASYVSAEINAMHAAAKKQNLLFMMECGLDPGIDHMSAITLIHRLKVIGAEITSFESYTGGLVHPDYIHAPWNYKVTWNPRNVVLAGQGADAQYCSGGKIKTVGYDQLFVNPSVWELSKEEMYEGYPNRDSIRYQALYELEQAQTFIRGTLRYPGFCEGWNYIIQLGLTNDTLFLPEDAARTAYSFLQQHVSAEGKTLEEKLKILFKEKTTSAINYLNALGLLDNTPIMTAAATAAQILQSIIEYKWKLEAGDKDRIVMIHRISYLLNKKLKTIQSSMIVDGEDSERTAMSKTVGLPLAIALDLFLKDNIKERGVVIPTSIEMSTTILSKLSIFGIEFIETEV
jgi:saccharopine dehydrogenase-like NADP-dependent oxidoreductase